MSSFLRDLAGISCMLGAGVWAESLSWANPDATDKRLWLDHPLQLLGSAALVMLGLVLIMPTALKEDDK